MSNLKQYVIVRKDLQLNAGELAAQVAHLSANFITAKITGDIVFTNMEMEWFKSPYLIVLEVNNCDELEMVKQLALEHDASFIVWKDTVKSKTFDAWYKTQIGLSLEINDSDALKPIVGRLQLYNGG